MFTPVAPKLRNFLFRNLVDKADPEINSRKTLEYEFSNGRRFTRNTSRNRTA